MLRNGLHLPRVNLPIAPGLLFPEKLGEFRGGIGDAIIFGALGSSASSLPSFVQPESQSKRLWNRKVGDMRRPHLLANELGLP